MTALALFAAYQQQAIQDRPASIIVQPAWSMAGLFLGGMLPFCSARWP